MKAKLLALALVVSSFALAPFAKADSITLQSHTGNSYDYGITFDNSFDVFFFQGFQLTGLSGVTNAVLNGDLATNFGVIAFDATSITVGTIFDTEFDLNTPFTVGTLVVTSASPMGNVNFNLSDSNGLFNGTIGGPVSGSSPSPVPEPASLVLLGSGLIAAAGVARKKLFA